MIAQVADSLGSLTHLVSWTLIHSLWQGAVISMLLAAALYVFRQSPARVRYGIACGALLTLVLTICVTAMTIYQTPPAQVSTQQPQITIEGQVTEASNSPGLPPTSPSRRTGPSWPGPSGAPRRNRGRPSASSGSGPSAPTGGPSSWRRPWWACPTFPGWKGWWSPAGT